jgi:ketosteroid isomerase-like protein
MLSSLVVASLALPGLSAKAQIPAPFPHIVAMSADQNAVVGVMRAMYHAAATDDLMKFHELIAPGFYAFDGGKRYEAEELMGMIMDYHSKGIKFVWAVTKPDVHIAGDQAWVTYTNSGSITMGKGQTPTPTTWLESAALVKRNGTWKLAFLHSTRVPVTMPTK